MIEAKQHWRILLGLSYIVEESLPINVSYLKNILVYQCMFRKIFSLVCNSIIGNTETVCLLSTEHSRSTKIAFNLCIYHECICGRKGVSVICINSHHLLEFE